MVDVEYQFALLAYFNYRISLQNFCLLVIKNVLLTASVVKSDLDWDQLVSLSLHSVIAELAARTVIPRNG